MIENVQIYVKCRNNHSYIKAKEVKSPVNLFEQVKLIDSEIVQKKNFLRMWAVLILCFTLFQLGTQQTFQYSRGWTNGKRNADSDHRVGFVKPHLYRFGHDSDR